MKKTGQLLKEKREAAKLSLSEVALATKINPKILTAMEEGNKSALPAKTFLRGFLKSYALYLKMDPEEILRSYQEELGPPPQPERVHEIDQPQPAQPATTPKQERRRMGDDNSSSLRAAAVIVIIVLIGVIIGVRELIEKYQREKTVESAAIKVSPLEQPPVIPETAKPGAASADPANASVTPTTPAPGAPAVEAAPAAAATTEPPAPQKPAQTEVVAPPAPVAAVAPAVAPVPAPTATAVTPAAPKIEETKAVPPAPPKPETPAPKEEAASADPASKKSKNEIILEALDKVEVKFQIKGETKRVSLGPTQVHTIHADQPVTLDLSDGGAVNIILNGHERGVPGDLGKPKTIKIP